MRARDDGLVRVKPLLARVGDWAEFLAQRLAADERAAIRSGERTGRPLGSAPFVKQIEKRLSRKLARQKPGPKPNAVAAGNQDCVPEIRVMLWAPQGLWGYVAERYGLVLFPVRRRLIRPDER